MNSKDQSPITSHQSPRKAVVTGGAGFIGSHLAETLAEQGYHVIVLDDLSAARNESIEDVLRKDNVEFAQGSITDRPLLQKLFHGAHCIFHLAAAVSVPQSIDDPRSCHETNLTGTLNVFIAARDNGVAKVVYSSSSAVYGDLPATPAIESLTLNPKSPYAVTKLAGEHYGQVFQEVYGLPTISLRYFNVYGPRQNPNSEYSGVITKFIDLVSRGKPPVIFDDGEQTRDFVYVKDVVEATILAAKTKASGVFNIAAGASFTVNRLAELVTELMGKDLEPIHQQPRPGDIRYSLADISKARGLGFAPQYGLKEGLRETLRSMLS